jgi:hypothetical protein
MRLAAVEQRCVKIDYHSVNLKGLVYNAITGILQFKNFIVDLPVGELGS